MKISFVFSLIFICCRAASQTSMHIEVKKIVLLDENESYTMRWVFRDSTGKGEISIFAKKTAGDSILVFHSHTLNQFLTGKAEWRDTRGRLIKTGEYTGENTGSLEEITNPMHLPLLASPDGEIKTWYQNDEEGNLVPNIIEHYSKGKKHGTQHYFYAQGMVARIENYSEGLPHGMFASYYASGRTETTGDFTQGKETGWWTSYFPDGSLRDKDHYTNGKRDTVYTYYKGGILKSVYYFYSGRSWLPAMEYDSLGRLRHYRSFNTDGIQDGTYVGYYVNGQKSYEGYMKNGVAQGRWYEWHENGNLKVRGNYKDGSPWGKWEYFNSDGKLTLVKNRYETAEPPPDEVSLVEGIIEEQPAFIYATEEPEFRGGNHFYLNGKLKLSTKIRSVKVMVKSFKDQRSEFIILTSMKEKDREELLRYLNDEFRKMMPMKLNGKAYTTHLEAMLVFY